MITRNVPQERVRYWLDYNSETGEFIWRWSPCARVKRGSIAGTSPANGYRLIGLRGYGQVGAHRLAWIHAYGPIPDGMEIDHINGDPSDNRLCNLRLATSAQQKMNKVVQSNNRSGLKGAYFHACRKGRKWRSQIKANGTLHFLGYFETAEEAHEAYVAASRRLFKDFHPVRAELEVRP
jgi:hypothetical protein